MDEELVWSIPLSSMRRPDRRFGGVMLLWPIVKKFPGGPFYAICFFVVAHCNDAEMGVFYTIIWCLWQRHNKWIFMNQMPTSTQTVAWAGRLLSDFLVYNGLDKPTEKKTLASKIFGKFSPLIGECLAVREGVCLANFFGLDNWLVESDALNTVSAIQNPVAGAP
ncbi:hypothetical protein TIFTF001_006717 [Ficus carica]|uniref:RNase H type-1 domain-containing protein n=1 Tax=Ficus carica TaxID=3494 RepID=A0AA87ZPY8_FICCA|nr:hypothetical protein TIFTF001_006717 [Ficus carica]